MNISEVSQSIITNLVRSLAVQQTQDRSKLVELTAEKKRLEGEVTILNSCQEQSAKYNSVLVSPRLHRLAIVKADIKSLELELAAIESAIKACRV